MDSTLGSVLLITSIASFASISAAALLSFFFKSKSGNRLLGVSAGVMLALPFLHILPEAFEGKAAPYHLFAFLLAGLLGFFVLEKLLLVLQTPPSCGSMHEVCQGPIYLVSPHARWVVITGDSLHNFTDGIMVSAAFLADPGLGVLTGLATAAHELPQEFSDFMLLLESGCSRWRAYVLNLVSGTAGTLGGLCGCLMLERASESIPYLLAFASSGLLYNALRHSMPKLKQSRAIKEVLPQLTLIGLGIILVSLVRH